MSFTPITITGTFTRPDTTGAEGSVTLTLTETIRNGTETVEPNPVLALVQEGELLAEDGQPLVVVANDDTGTSPVGSRYVFLVQVDNAPVSTWEAIVPHTAPEGKIDISELEPSIP
jgi:hypothetical protein